MEIRCRQGYKKQYITKDDKYFIFVYNIPSEDMNEKMYLYYEGEQTTNNKLEVKLSPTNLDVQTEVGTYKLGESIDFKDSILKNSTISITNMYLTNKISYNYCYKEDCNYSATIHSLGNTILYLNYNKKTDPDISFNTNWSNLLNNYITIKYIYNDEEYTSSLNNKTPDDAVSKGLYLEVDKNIESASSIWLEFNIRNKIYKYYIK